jgi:hypothetical protein
VFALCKVPPGKGYAGNDNDADNGFQQAVGNFLYDEKADDNQQ